jgi:hypothetical protein
VQLIAQAACAIYWFNPLVWMAAAQLRSERERACDDAVLRGGALASAYAGHLLDIARELRPALRPSAALAMARRSDLEGRLLAVLADHARIPWQTSRWAVAAVVVSSSVVAIGATTSASPTRGEMLAPSLVNFSVARDIANSTDAQAETRARAEAKATLRQSPNPAARERAAVDLGAAPQQDGLHPLQQALHDPDPDVREKAALGLAFMSGRDVIPALLQALGDSSGQVREKAAIGLALRRDERVIEPLLAAMDDPDAQVREKVAIALGTSGDPRAYDALTKALRDPDSQVREKAVSGLVLLGPR